MSAFVVEDETIDRIVDYIDGKVRREWQWAYREIHAAAEVEQGDRDGLGAALLSMNVAAVDQRYSERNEIPEYSHHYRLSGMVQTLVALKCYMYQCTEGDVPERPLFGLLEKVRLDLAERIVRGLPEYDKAAETCWR